MTPFFHFFPADCFMRAFIPRSEGFLTASFLAGGRRMWMAVVFVAVAVSLAVAWQLFNSRIESQKNALALTAAKAAANVDHEMTVRAFSVTAMQRTATQFMDGRLELSMNPAAYIERVEAKQGYTLAALPGYGRQQLGRITGISATPAPGSARMREIVMAIGLSPLFQTVLARDADTPWVYYFSASEFLYLYPQVSIEEFFYADLTGKDFYQLATPGRNPRREVYWTPPYLDEGGKGLMVTVGAPVYKGDDFLGAICIDIALSKLGNLLALYEFPKAEVFLYGAQGEKLAGTGEDVGFWPPAFRPREFIDEGGSLLYAVPLKTVPWYLVVSASSASLARTAFWQAFPVVLVVALLLSSLILLAALSRSWRRIHQLSFHDSLTGLFNRRHFDAVFKNELDHAMRNGSHFGFILLDVDFFKRYNDTLGHPAGDLVLATVAQAMREMLKRPGDMAFRIGGEEFAVLTKGKGPEQIAAFTNSIREVIEAKAFDFPASPFGRVTVSAGFFVAAPGSGETVGEIYQRADKALYQAKQAGRNRVETG